MADNEPSTSGCPVKFGQIPGINKKQQHTQSNESQHDNTARDTSNNNFKSHHQHQQQQQQQQQHQRNLHEPSSPKEPQHLKIMPSPPALPIIGHLHLLKDYAHNPWEGFQQIRKQFGDIVALKMGIHNIVLVSNSDDMREILLKKGDIFVDRPTFPRHHIIFGGDKENSLALCNWSKVHRDRRKMCKRGIIPNKFSARNQLLEHTISKFVKKFIASITSNTTTSGNYHNLSKEELLLLNSDIFMDFLCSDEHSHSSQDYREFVRGCDFVFWDINQSYLIDFLPYLTSLGVGYWYLRKLQKKTDFLRDYIDDRIFLPRFKKHLDRASAKDTDNTQNNPPTLDTTNSRGIKGLEEEESQDYLDSVILEHLSKSTHMTLADYKTGFADLLAGFAAVANLLVRLLGHLSLDQKLQDMIYEEAKKVDIPDVDHKPSLPITEAALLECLRFASSPIVPHVAREDTSIGGYYAPEGTMVLFNNYHVNLSEQLWDDPMLFNPMRFLKVQEDGFGGQYYKTDSPKYFMPFSVGMRQCLGHRMVETINIMAVAHICRNFVIKANDENLVRRLLTPIGSAALNPDETCFELQLYRR